MSIKLTPFNYDNLCFGHTWTIADQSALAVDIGRVALGQSWRVQQILAGAKLGPQPTSTEALAGAIELLSVSGADPWHRDGWMFQVMSWIAARTVAPLGIIRPPHMIHAHKGFDGLALEVDDDGLVKAAIIFEDKATDSPRDVIRDEVWKDFKRFEEGKSENVLTAEVVALLHTRPGLNPDKAIEAVLWKNVRRYRVCITVGDTHASEKGRKRLFSDYNTIVPGENEKRRGETFYVPELRNWMANLAEQAIASAKTVVANV